MIKNCLICSINHLWGQSNYKYLVLRSYYQFTMNIRAIKFNNYKKNNNCNLKNLIHQYWNNLVRHNYQLKLQSHWSNNVKRRYKIMRGSKTNNNRFFHIINIVNLANREYLLRLLLPIPNLNKTSRHRMKRIIFKISDIIKNDN